MKCVQSPSNADGLAEIRRVTEYEAKLLVVKGWHYVPKGVWKRSVRPNLTNAKAKAKELVSGLRRV